MVYKNQRGPRCRNSWRPSDGPPAREHEEPQRSPIAKPQAPSLWSSSTRAQRSVWTWSDYNKRSILATTLAKPEPPDRTFKNPNNVPVAPRCSYTARLPPPALRSQPERKLDDEPLPQIWRQSIDDLIRRTAHDYDLVMNYERDAEGGQRWLPEDIATIRDVSKSLHRDIFALMRRRRVIAGLRDQDSKDLMTQAKSAANLVKLRCERVQSAINKYEQKCEFELLRDGVYEQDEDGNFYKPIVPQPYVVEADFQDFPYRSSEYGEAYSPGRRCYNEQRQHEDSRRDILGAQPLPEVHLSSQPIDLRDLNSAFQAPSFDEHEHENAHPRSEGVRQAARQADSSRSDRVYSGRISKSHQDKSSGNPPRFAHVLHCQKIDT